MTCCYFFLLRVPHTLELGSNPLAFLHFTRSVLLNLFPLSRCCTRGLCCVGLLPKCSLLLLVWSSPGCFQDHCSATMKRFKAVCCLCCCSARLLSVGLGPVVTPGSRPVEPEGHIGMTKCTVAQLLCTQGCVVLNHYSIGPVIILTLLAFAPGIRQVGHQSEAEILDESVGAAWHWLFHRLSGYSKCLDSVSWLHW